MARHAFAADRLKSLCRAIHASCRKLGMDEETRRSMLFNVTGKRSTTELTLTDCDKVLDHLFDKGAPRPTKKKAVGVYPGTPNNIDRKPMLDKIEAQLADMKLPWSYAVAIAKRQTPVTVGVCIERLEWVPNKGLSAVISALEVEQKKRARLEDIDATLKRIGKTRADVSEMLAKAGITDKWDRNLKRLSFVGNALPVWWPE